MEKKFKELNEAQEVLTDPDKRKKYDQYGADWDQAQAFEKARQQARTQGFGGPWGSEGDYTGQGDSGSGNDHFSDFFENIFGNRGRGGAGRSVLECRERTSRPKFQLRLREVLTGVTKRVNLREPRTCSTCQGSGTVRGGHARSAREPAMTNTETIEVRIPTGVQDGTRSEGCRKGPAWYEWRKTRRSVSSCGYSSRIPSFVGKVQTCMSPCPFILGKPFSGLR